MGKEATIGLAVILILLIVFGVVLVRRLSGSADGPPVLLAEQDGSGIWRPAIDPGAGKSQRESAAAAPAKLRVVSANPLTDAEPAPGPSPAVFETQYLRPADVAVPGEIAEPLDPYGPYKGQDDRTATVGTAETGLPPADLGPVGLPRQIPQQLSGDGGHLGSGEPAADMTASRESQVSGPAGLGGGQVYVVEEGDTLLDIARRVLGAASRWVEVYELNRDLLGNDPGCIRPGMQLLLPSEEPGAGFARRPSPEYQPDDRQVVPGHR
jgi:nucleoid-associated protein YgaU